MNDTYICVVGTALNRPERRLINNSDAFVASFRVASHPRHFNQKTDQWADSPNLRIKVNCWRRLGEHVCSSVIAGDPVVVYGRISTRAWKTEQGEPRISYELEANAVGHDLARGTAEFRKTRHDLAAAVVDDEDSDNRINGERTQSFEEHLAQLASDEGADTAYDNELGYGERLGKDYNTDAPVSDLDAIAILREAGLDQVSPVAEGGDDEDTGEEELSGAAPGSGGTAGRSRRRGRQPVPA
jgi:single-strand DNA-binding protein